MDLWGSIVCPFCGQEFGVAVDTTTTTQRFVIDCENCCRPMEVRAVCRPGEILSLEAGPG
jgi:transcription elongation factor Elf1